MFACVQRHVAVYFSFHWMIAPVKQVAVAFFLLPVICNLFLLAAYRFTAENQFCYVENFLGLQVISCRKEWVSGTSSAHELKIISAYCRLCAQTVCSLHFFTNMRLSNRVLRFFFCSVKKMAASNEWCRYMYAHILTVQRSSNLSRTKCTRKT